MILIAKLFLVMEYHVYTSFGISIEFCSRPNNKIAETEQGYIASSNICYNILCLVIKEVEAKELGIVMIALIIDKRIEEVSIAFVDDTDFSTNGEDCQTKI